LEGDRVIALDAGADDFVAKPFSGPELLARIRAVIRRQAPKKKLGSIKVGSVEIDLERRRALIEDVEVRLSAREHALLTLLAKHEGGVVTHQDIIEHVWGDGAKAETQSVRVLVGQLRQKMEADPSNPTFICTEPGVGYRLAGS
jgi:two-component system KDP operon response regulator KdpE